MTQYPTSINSTIQINIECDFTCVCTVYNAHIRNTQLAIPHQQLRPLHPFSVDVHEYISENSELCTTWHELLICPLAFLSVQSKTQYTSGPFYSEKRMLH